MKKPDLDGRYGHPRPPARRAAVVLSILIGSVSCVWLGWVIWFQATPDVQSQLQRFTVEDEHTVKVEIAVELTDPDIQANCILRAQSEDHAIVGELNYPVTGTTGATRHQVEIKTEREATAVDFIGCTSPDQNRPR